LVCCHGVQSANESTGTAIFIGIVTNINALSFAKVIMCVGSTLLIVLLPKEPWQLELLSARITVIAIFQLTISQMQK